MNKEMSKKLMCIVMRNGLEIWKEEDRLIELQRALENNKIGFIRVDGNLINSVDIMGICDAKTMNNYQKGKQGTWKCDWGKWHNKGEQCACGELNKYKIWKAPT